MKYPFLMTSGCSRVSKWTKASAVLCNITINNDLSTETLFLCFSYCSHFTCDYRSVFVQRHIWCSFPALLHCGCSECCRLSRLFVRQLSFSSLQFSSGEIVSRILAVNMSCQYRTNLGERLRLTSPSGSIDCCCFLFVYLFTVWIVFPRRQHKWRKREAVCVQRAQGQGG